MVTEGPKWIPGTVKGEAVNSKMAFFIKFGNSIKILQGLYEDDNGNESYEVFSIVEEMPIPSTKGMDSYYEEIYSNLRLPRSVKKGKIKGTIHVEFIVEKDGSLNAFHIRRGLNKECDKEAIRVIQEGPTWTAGKQRGRPVNVRKILPIAFGEDPPVMDTAVKGLVKDENGNPIPGCNIVIEGTTTGTVTDLHGQFSLKMKSSNKAQRIIISSRGFITQSRTAHNGSIHVFVLKKAEPISVKIWGLDFMEDEQPLYILDGKELNQKEVEKLNPNEIKSISVLKDKSATSKYGEKGKNGVILIETKKGDQKIQIKSEMKLDGANPPLIYIDGKEAAKNAMEELDPNTIDSIEILKGESAASKYGEKGKNGVILIKLKK